MRALLISCCAPRSRRHRCPRTIARRPPSAVAPRTPTRISTTGRRRTRCSAGFNMQVCLDNIRYCRRHSRRYRYGPFADKLAGRVKGLLDLGALLHQSLPGTSTRQSTLFRVIWTMSTLYASPHNLLSKASDVYAAPPPASSATRPPPLPTPAPPPRPPPALTPSPHAAQHGPVRELQADDARGHEPDGNELTRRTSGRRAPTTTRSSRLRIR